MKKNIEEPLKSISRYRIFTLKYIYGYKYMPSITRKGKNKDAKSYHGDCKDY